MSVTTGRPPTPYTFSNDLPTAVTLLAALAEMLDTFTQRRLTAAGIPAGARCLEVGAGNGSIALWLAEQTGPGGAVIATDVRTQHIPCQHIPCPPIPRLPVFRLHIPGHAQVVVLEHDIAVDRLPDGEFDLIHARAVLQHLPERETILARLAAALAPGGVLVVEELEAHWSTAVLATPDPAAHDTFAAYETALSAILASAGNDRTWCRRVHAAMIEAGLHQVTTEGWESSWPGGTGAALLAYAGSTEKHQQLLDAGMDAGQLATLQSLAMNPALVLRGIPLLSTIGRRPA
jgi:SAM-dependent methyltransferase